MFLFAQSEKFGKNAISKVGKESKPTNKGSPPHPVGSSQGSTMKLVCSTLCSRVPWEGSGGWDIFSNLYINFALLLLLFSFYDKWEVKCCSLKRRTSIFPALQGWPISWDTEFASNHWNSMLGDRLEHQWYWWRWELTNRLKWKWTNLWFYHQNYVYSFSNFP